MLVVVRLGSHLPLPGIDKEAMANLFAQGGILGFFDLFAGGALSRFSVFALGIMPYINASIIMSLLQAVVPILEQWAKEGEEGRTKITKITRYSTVFLAIIQAFGISCLLYTSDAADEEDSVDLGGSRIITQKKNQIETITR